MVRKGTWSTLLKIIIICQLLKKISMEEFFTLFLLTFLTYSCNRFVSLCVSLSYSYSLHLTLSLSLTYSLPLSLAFSHLLFLTNSLSLSLSLCIYKSSSLLLWISITLCLLIWISSDIIVSQEPYLNSLMALENIRLQSGNSSSSLW